MKQIGSTLDKGFIVEMNHGEVVAFDRLSRAIEGRSMWESEGFFPEERLRQENDLSNAIEWVLAYATSIGVLNEAKKHLNNAMAALGRKSA